MWKMRLDIAAGLLLLFATSASGSIVRVDDGAAPGGDGLSWPTAFTSLQAALAASVGDSGVTEIRVAAGTYRPDDAMDRTATFTLLPGIAIRGGYAGQGAADPDARDVAQFVSILSGDLASDDAPVELDPFAGTDENSHNVVTAIDVEPTAILDGFVVEAGNSLGGPSETGAGIRVSGVGAPTLVNLVVRRNQSNTGGGVWLGGGAAILADSVIEGNVAQRGGGVGIAGVERPTIAGCTIANNRADRGGGLWVDFFSVLIVGCDIRDNEATLDGGGVGCIFGVVSDIISTTIANNAAGERGGGIFADADSRTQVWQCAIFGNTATDGAGVAAITSLGLNVANTLLNGNIATGNGGGIWWLDTPAEIANCTIYGNTAFLGGGVHAAADVFLDTIELRNSILWANQGTSGRGPQISLGVAPFASGDLDTLIVDACDVEEGEGRVFISAASAWQLSWRPSNIDSDPLFFDPDGPDLAPDLGDEDFRLLAASPCVDAGDDNALPLDQFDLDNDGDTQEALPIDLGGAPRFAPGTCDAPEQLDIGAFERMPVCCPADLNDDGLVGFDDLGTLLLSWGPCARCVADINGSGAVDFDDLTTLIMAWGACPPDP